ncbi:MAG: ATP-dependent RecD-like DNA helicase [Longicatena sp.]
MKDEEILQAKLVHTIFRNEQNGYSVAKFVTYDTLEEDFSATGYFSELYEDEIYKLHGTYVDHPRYGIQFQVSAYEKMMPSDETSLIRYFSSSLFSGIGKQTAAAIVEVLGEDAIAKIKADESVLEQVTILNDKKRQSIIKGIKEHEEGDDSVAFFSRFGISIKNIMKMEACYGEESVAVVKENPYRLIEEIDGIGFRTADKLAEELHFEKDHPYRLKAALLSVVLDLCMRNGDTYTSKEQVHKRIRKEFDFELDEQQYMEELVHERLLFVEDERIYHHTQYDAEKGIATFLAHFPYVEEEKLPDASLIHDMKELEERLSITYEAKQQQAITDFFHQPFSIITGGPGTGKTTIVQGILSLYHKYFPSNLVSLCAPTGRASKRLSELSNEGATTIHSLLKWDLEANTFLVNEKDPISTDLLIIDEFSMVDQWLFYNLLKASRNIKKILIIGDEDQLPSVGPGCVLKDMIESQKFCVSRLEKIFRQSVGSDVVTLAHEIREGKADILDNAKDIAFFNCENYEVKDVLLRIVSNALEKGYENKDIQVLAPMYGGVAGIDALNNALQKMMNPSSPHKKEIKIGYHVYRENDKVLQLKNQPEDDVYNGDIGKILEIESANNDSYHQHHILVDFDGIIVEYSGEQIYNITHAYCISIHKSQGSEYPIVIMPVVKDYRYMLQKRLMYTGVTRAKKSLVLLGDVTVFKHAIQVQDRHDRKSTLTQKILHKFV